MPTLLETWNQFLQERSISLSPTSLCTDYKQATKWLERCPVQDLEQGRQVIIWILGQQPIKSARRVCMFTRSMYRWAASEDVGILARNPVANFKMPKAPQEDHEIVVIPKDELTLIMIALASKGHHRKVRWDLFAEFMLQTGMRTGEVRALRWSDIDPDANRILVHSNYTLTHGLKIAQKRTSSVGYLLIKKYKRSWVVSPGKTITCSPGIATLSRLIFAKRSTNYFKPAWSKSVTGRTTSGMLPLAAG